ncbi:LOW QUALITY PROTEIN: hypothetical protein PanWU01x14_201620 [Parasponia andersonii]|uniref:Secreted protein n=1 Tax=Parasponia andersonii TaxID=3476 RepID=A0A2P5BXD1_PARAD|nr:LOW QUALITY PROTEIN: hypothetical protein PanWU01x14_201620 [Parasponia andersonii]
MIKADFALLWFFLHTIRFFKICIRPPNAIITTALDAGIHNNWSLQMQYMNEKRMSQNTGWKNFRCSKSKFHQYQIHITTLCPNLEFKFRFVHFLQSTDQTYKLQPT